MDNLGQQCPSPLVEKRLLQFAIALGGLVPVGAGLQGVFRGAAFLGRWPGRASDSHFRYLSGLLLGIGLVFWGSIPAVERRGVILRLLTLVVVVGGLARLYGWVVEGDPGTIRWALVMELVVTPLLCLWQARIGSSNSSGSSEA